MASMSSGHMLSWSDFRRLIDQPYWDELSDNRDNINSNPSGDVMSTACPVGENTSRPRSVGPWVNWPAAQLPVETFENIINFLPRESIQNMRLVCKEFELKVSWVLFKTVVVPFRPEIYGLVESVDPSKAGKRRKRNNGKGKATAFEGHSSDADGPLRMKDNGMKIFQGFGHHIVRFGMSFEVDEETLSTPPEKGTQEVYDTFWGTYEWPFKFYHRYALCAGLEFTADETRSMTTAFSELSRVKELGLSMDNGLGWLCGPDVSERTKILKTKPYVFGRSRSIPDVKEKEQQDAWRQVLKKRKDDQRKERTKKELEMRAIYRNMRAGFNSSPLISPATNTVTATAVPTNPAVTTGATSASSMTPLMDLASSGESSDDVLMVDPEEYSSSDDSLTHESALMYAGHEDKSKWEQFNSLSNPAFIPNNLTEAQKEWLLETEWAQRAFLASYTLAIIDNRQIFQAVHSLNIARLSSRHISVLERKDFWATLPNLNTLSLFVIPDWREISKHGTSFISTVPIEPSSAVSRVHGILEQYISPLASVKTLRIGWVGGGESAPGYFARNRHILSAPIVPLSFDLLDVSKPFPLLALPHVENLTLSNCWVSPRALIAFVRNLKYKGLRTLKLDSVSLTALPRLGLVNVPQEAANPPPQPGPGVPVVGNNFIAGAWNIPVEGADHPPVDPLKEQFRAGSWIEVIEALTPGITLARLKWDNGLTTRLPRRNNYNLQLIELSSCGYVRIGLQWNQASVDPPHHTRLPASAMSKRRTDLAPLMMTTNDSMLGTIVDYIRPLEMKTLRVIWGMQSGWAEDRKKYEPCEDGWPVGGTGRFTGSVQRDSGGGA